MLCLCLVLASVVVYSVLLAQWERTGYAGSFETWAARFLGKRADAVPAKVATGIAGNLVKWPAVFAQIALIAE